MLTVRFDFLASCDVYSGIPVHLTRITLLQIFHVVSESLLFLFKGNTKLRLTFFLEFDFIPHYLVL